MKPISLFFYVFFGLWAIVAGIWLLSSFVWLEWSPIYWGLMRGCLFVFTLIAGCVAFCAATE